MAVYCKPSFNEYLSVFNPSNWICGVNNDGTTTSGGISLAYANANFLKFPTAQGSETLVNIDVLGTSQFNGSLNEFTNQTDFNGITNFNNGIRLNVGNLRFPDTTIQTTAYTGTAGVASSVVVANGGSGAMYLALTQGTAGNYPILTNTPQYNATSGVLSAPQFTGNLNGNANTSTTATTATQANTVSISNTGANTNYFIPLMINTTSGYKTLLGGGSLNFNPATNTISSPNITASSSVSSPFYTSPSGGITRWYSTDNTQYGQIYSDNSYFLKINPAYKLGLIMNTQGASNPGAVNPTYTQGCDIGWNYSGEGSTDFYNNAGLQGTTTHQAFSFWDASTVLVQQAIAYIPRIQSAFSATGLNIPTYDWVNGTIATAISALPGGSAYLNAGTALSNQIFTGWNTFSNLLTASAGISSIGGRNYGYTSGSNWMYIQATCNVLLNGGINYFKPNALYTLDGDLSMFITSNYATGGYFQVVNTGVYEIAVSFSIINAVSVNNAQISLYSGAIPTTFLNRSCNYNTTPLNMYGSGTWTIQLTAGTDYGFMNSINSTPFNSTGTYSMSVIRIM